MKFQVIHVVRNPHTGVARIIDELIKQQKIDGYNSSILVIASSEWKKYDWMTVESKDILRISKDISGTIIFLMHLFGYKKKTLNDEIRRRIGNQNTILHYHNAWLSCAFMGFNFSPKVKRVVTYHGLASEHALARQPIRRWIHGKLANLTNYMCDAVITVDPTTPERAKKLFNTNNDDYIFIANGANSTGFDNEEKLNAHKSYITVGHLGTIDYGKGWQVTAQAIDICVENGIKVKYLIAGDGEQRKLAEDYADKRVGHVDYIGWIDDVHNDFFSKIDLLVMPSNSEGMPVAALEAIANAVPVIATDVGGLPAIIGDDEAGVIISRDPRELSNVITTYANDNERLVALRKSAVNRWRKYFSLRTMSKNYNDVYTRVMQS